MKINSSVIQLNREELANIRERYHIDNVPLSELEKMYVIIGSVINGEIYYTMDTQNSLNIDMDGYSICVVTLGDGVDKKHQYYMEQGELLKAYIIDILGMELLKKLYNIVSDRFNKTYKSYISEYVFLGDKYPIELVRDIFKIFDIKNITYNEAYAFIPMKTAVFIGKVSNVKVKVCMDICSSCNNANCENRISS